jgi:ABC-type uncharacterized transport system auxiliary subunit
MRRMISFVTISLLAVGLGSCGSARPIRHYTLQLPAVPDPSPTNVYPFTLVVGRIQAPEILEEEPIVYRTGPNEIDTYPYHQWVEPPAQLVRDRLARRLRDSGKYRSVVQLGSSLQGDFVLHGKLYDFEEVDAERIETLVTMEFELVDPKTHTAVWTHYYSQRQPVPGKTIPEVVTSLDRNLEQGLTEISAGLDAYFAARLNAKH